MRRAYETLCGFSPFRGEGSYVRPVSAETLPLSKFHFGGLGTNMMKRVMRENRMPGIPELMETAKDLGVQFIACTTTMGLMGITKDTLIDSVDQLAGVTTYLNEARQGAVNLFI